MNAEPMTNWPIFSKNKLENVSAYVTAFCHCANRVHDITDAEALDWFVHGLHLGAAKGCINKGPTHM